LTNQDFNFDAEFGARYDNFVRQAIFGYEQMFPMILAFLSPGLGDQANVLVVGSGTGMELATFGSCMPAWTFTGVDPSEQMIRLARAKLESLNLSERVCLHHGTVDGLAQDQLFDAATLNLVLHFVPDNGAKRALLQGIAERLKPGARLVLMDMGGDPQSERYRATQGCWKNYMLQRGMTSAGVDALFKQAAETQHFIPETRLLELLAETGFGPVEKIYQAFLNSGWVAQKG
jgi:tRNA (cmo5U34)-methyltransferase